MSAPAEGRSAKRLSARDSLAPTLRRCEPQWSHGGAR
jgi:hypothetical protein